MYLILQLELLHLTAFIPYTLEQQSYCQSCVTKHARQLLVLPSKATILSLPKALHHTNPITNLMCPSDCNFRIEVLDMLLCPNGGLDLMFDRFAPV
jgi:hypothetical protein